MFVKTASLMALMGGSALASNHHQHLHKRDVAYETDVVYDTVVVATATEWVSPGQATEAPTYQPAPAPVYQPAPAPQPASQPAPAPQPAPQPAPAPASDDNGGLDDYISCVNKYRGVLGLSSLQLDQDLQNGIQQTVNNGNGQMVHAFYDDATGQVLAPAPEMDFEKAFLQGWLCEAWWLPVLKPLCSLGTYNFEGQTGHYDILSNPDLTHCGCAWSQGIWGCDVR